MSEYYDSRELSIPMLRNIAIKYKLITIMMLTCISALVLAGGAFIVWENYTLRESVIRTLSIQAKIIADNCSTALITDDATDVKKALSALRVEPSIIYACVRDEDGGVFASYHRGTTDGSLHILAVKEDGYGFGNTSLSVTENIILKEQIIGTVWIKSDLNPMQVTLKRNAALIIGVLIFASLVACLCSFKLQNVISRPILKLAKIARLISENKDYSIRVPKHSNDELGSLIGAFNEMLEQIQHRDLALVKAKQQLETRVRERTSELTDANGKLKTEVLERQRAEEKLKTTHKELMNASRHAGMAEVATNVLHNVGNVLNSINVSIELTTEKVSNSKIPNLKKITNMIEENIDNIDEFFTKDNRGKHIPMYLTKIADILTDEHKEIAGKLQSVAGNVQHIKEIINTQQSCAKALGVEEPTLISEITEDAINIDTESFDHHGIVLVRDFVELPEVNVDKHKVLQILVNLISNAKDALAQSDAEEKLLTIKSYKHAEDRLRIEVSDNGIGISAENLTKIFRHGFTTKKNGNGFGLHSCALAAKEMGGSLSAQSSGSGHGATLTLEIPFKPVEVLR